MGPTDGQCSPDLPVSIRHSSGDSFFPFRRCKLSNQPLTPEPQVGQDECQPHKPRHECVRTAQRLRSSNLRFLRGTRQDVVQFSDQVIRSSQIVLNWRSPQLESCVTATRRFNPGWGAWVKFTVTFHSPLASLERAIFGTPCLSC